MSQQVTISSITANTPVDIYYCDSLSANCIFVSGVTIFPYTFIVPPPYDETNIIIKIIDNEGCVDGEVIPITPTPTSSVTPTNTLTPTVTPTNTKTPTQTPTQTLTQTILQQIPQQKLRLQPKHLWLHLIMLVKIHTQLQGMFVMTL